MAHKSCMKESVNRPINANRNESVPLVFARFSSIYGTSPQFLSEQFLTLIT